MSRLCSSSSSVDVNEAEFVLSYEMLRSRDEVSFQKLKQTSGCTKKNTRNKQMDKKPSCSTTISLPYLEVSSLVYGKEMMHDERNMFTHLSLRAHLTLV